ncbi:hypothetical protein [Marinomonas sp. FW-1]|uniref:hypothetical protein n=1 Tax=Marinomonas sp. FW-1 TaxID=2071621 RepID=UPI0010C0E81C|nr:hypothetical protein [Marinomonas sp. FW-1]
MSKNRILILILVLFMTGCQQNVKSSAENAPTSEKEQENVAVTSENTDTKSTVQDVTTESSTTTKAVKSLTAAEKLTQQLIQKGQAALAAERLLTPVEDNANLYFQAVLGRDPGNYQAIQGISAIVDIYTQWAWESALRGEYASASRYIDSARSVNPEDPVIEEMVSRISDLQKKRAQVAKMSKSQAKQSSSEAAPKAPNEDQYLLPKTLFSMTDDEIISLIQPIIDKVAQADRPIAIHWPNDKEARLIYQIINSRVTEFRVRAMIYHRADYMVELQQD